MKNRLPAGQLTGLQGAHWVQAVDVTCQDLAGLIACLQPSGVSSLSALYPPKRVLEQTGVGRGLEQ